MKKYLMASVLVCLFIIPPLLSGNTIRFRSDIWAWLVLLMGVGAYSTHYLKINIWLILLSIYLYINACLSTMPIESLISYASYLGALILYVIFLKLSKEDFKFILKIFPLLFLLESTILIFQFYDPEIVLKALDLGKNVVRGTVSNPMMFGSMLIVLAVPLILHKRWYAIPMFIVLLCLNKHTSLSAFVIGSIFYILFKFNRNRNRIALCVISLLLLSVFGFGTIKDVVQCTLKPGGRWPIWKRTVEMANEKDKRIIGWGIGTFKYQFPLNSKDIAGGVLRGYNSGQTEEWRIGTYSGHHILWRRAHNDWLQFYFAAGIIGIILLTGFIGWIIYRFVISEKTDQLLITMAGLIAIGLDMSRCFPTKMLQLVPVIIFLLAYFTKLTDRKHEFT